MKGHKKKTITLFVPFLIILTLAPTIQAQPYAIDWWTVGGGNSTVEHTLTGGFWDLDPLRMIYLLLIIKN